MNNKDQSTFFGGLQSYTNNATSLNSLGFVYPVPVRRGSLVLALGFTRNNNFTSGLSFDGFNLGSSIIQTYARDGALYPSDLSGNLAYQLYLANLDTITGRFDSPIRDRVTQLGNVIEGGGINNYSVAGALDIAKNLSVGATLTFLSGSYKYDRSYREQDNAGIYSAFPFDFDELTIEDNVRSDISGVNGKLGLLYRVPDRFRLGIAVKTPTSFRITENFSTIARSYFDNGDVYPQDGPFESIGSGEYDVLTPWVFSGGVSFIIRDLMLAGDLEFTDWTQLEFSNANPEVIALNQDIKEIFRATANWRAGAEYDIREYGVRIRGGFMYNPSPFQGDPSSFDQKYVTGGLGILLSPSTMLDIGYARGWWKTFRVNYDRTSRVDEKITTNNFILTFSYRL
ncbi:MAG: outer membrane protein transport protein [Ignavibacteriae bacterium]|nr:outer membrane protein transport protein [Ignavibacteriota bacterium]